MLLDSNKSSASRAERIWITTLSRKAAFVWTLLLVIGFFILDLFLPLGVAAGVPYAVAVMTAMRTSRPSFILAITVLTVILTIFGLAMSPDGGESWKVIANRTLAVFVIVGAGVFAISAISVRHRATRQAILFEQIRRRRVQDTNVQLVRSAEARTEFLGQISHELRTPLTSLTTFAHILDQKSDTLSKERIKAHAEVIGRSARRLEVLIDDMFDASGTEAQSFKLNLTTVDVRQVISDTASDYSHHVKTRDQVLDVEIDIPENANREAIGDPARIAQVLTNLLSNASKYSWPGSKITVFCGLEKNNFIVKVLDRGDGINRNDLAKVFTPFFRVDNAEVRAVPDAGLGLTIVKSIVELHDGQVYIESEKGRGTTVSFTIPTLAST